MLAESGRLFSSEPEGIYHAGLYILRTCSKLRGSEHPLSIWACDDVAGGDRGPAPIPSILRMLKNAFGPQQGSEISLNIKVQFYFSVQQSSEMRDHVSFEADAIIKVLSGVVQANLPWFQQVNFIKTPSYRFNVF